MQKVLAATDLTVYAGAVGLIFLPPLIVFPLLPEASELMKQAAVMFLATIIIFSWLVRTLLTRTIRITMSILVPLFLIFVLVIGISTLLSVDPIASLLTLRASAPPSVVVVGLLAAVFIILTNQIRSISWVMRLAGVMSITASTIAISGMVSHATIGPLPTALWAVASILPLTIALLFTHWATHGKKNPVWIPPSVTVGIFIGMTVLQVLFLVTSGRSRSYPEPRPFEVGLPVAIRTLYSTPSPARLFFGSGPATFLQALASYYPQNITATSPTSLEEHTNTYLILLTTLGIVGLTAYLFLFIGALVVLAGAVRQKLDQKSLPLLIGCMGSLLVWLLGGLRAMHTTGTITLFVLCLMLVVSMGKIVGVPLTSPVIIPFGVRIKKPRRLVHDTITELLPIGLFLLSVLTILLLFIITARLVSAEVSLGFSKQALADSDIKRAYQHALTAVRANPLADYAHRHLAVTSLALSTSLITTADQPVEEATQQAGRLLVQAVTEAKASVRTGRQNSINWVLLGDVYAVLTRSVPNARAWSLAAYEEAAKREPTNIQLRTLIETLRAESQPATSGKPDVAGETSDNP